jgi:hypothetical protein
MFYFQGGPCEISQVSVQSFVLAKIYIFSQLSNYKKMCHIKFYKMANLFSRAICSFFTILFLGEFTELVAKNTKFIEIIQ